MERTRARRRGDDSHLINRASTCMIGRDHHDEQYENLIEVQSAKSIGSGDILMSDEITVSKDSHYYLKLILAFKNEVVKKNIRIVLYHPSNVRLEVKQMQGNKFSGSWYDDMKGRPMKVAQVVKENYSMT